MPECVVQWNRQWFPCESDISITVGLSNAMSFVRRRDPRAQAVCDVKAGKERELSKSSICSRSLGGDGITGSVAIPCSFLERMRMNLCMRS